MFLIGLGDWTWLRKESLSLLSYYKSTKLKSKENKDSKQNKQKNKIFKDYGTTTKYAIHIQWK